MNKIYSSILMAIAIITFSLSTVPAKSFAVESLPGWTVGTQIGNVMTYENNTNIETNAWNVQYFATNSKAGAFVVSPNAKNFTFGQAVEWGTYKIGYKTYRKYLFKGYHFWFKIPANSTVTVTESRTLPVTIPGIVYLK